jgi:glyoxylase-like metal-dependent hydrolase (beta-lactamase superfamily II)
LPRLFLPRLHLPPLHSSPLLAPHIHLIDLDYLGESRSVASVLILGSGGVAIVDPGPSTTLAVLRQRLAEHGASIADVTAILLTHIHLDHAGVTGTLVRENPRIRVYVHERGAPHVVDPSRLLKSASRIYGAEMQRLWGEVLAVPSEHLHVLTEADVLQVAGRVVRSAYTPGHAWHHVSYLDELSGVTFVGDTAGERYPGETYVLPVTPPPDVDIERWMMSSALIGEWKASQLVVTHFGAYSDVPRHLAEHADRLGRWASAVERSLAVEGSDAERMDRFVREINLELERCLPPHVAAHYLGSVRSSWDGLARYWRTKGKVA